MSHFSIYEIIMLVCFGASWPCAVIKTYQSKNVEGKSLLFLILILLGYVFGIIHKIVFSMDIVISLYVLNLVFVLLDLGFYYKFKKPALPKDKR